MTKSKSKKFKPANSSKLIVVQENLSPILEKESP